MSLLHKHKLNIYIAFVVIIVRLLFVGALFTYGGIEYIESVLIPGSDSLRYMQIGHNIAYEHVYSDRIDPPYTPEETIEPLYPLFLAGAETVSHSLVFAICMQVLLSGVAAFFISAIALRFFSRGSAILAGALFAFEPVGIYLAGAIFTESLFVPLFVASLYYFLRGVTEDDFTKKYMCLAGICAGLSALTRPEGQFFLYIYIGFYVIYAWRFFTRETAIRIAVFVVGFFIAALPWMARNKLTYGSWQTSVIGIHKVYLFDLVYFYAHEEHVSFKEARAALRERVSAISPYHTDDPTFANTPYIQRVVVDYITERPFSYALFYTVKTIPFFLSDGWRYVASKFGAVDAPTVNITGLLLEGEFGKLVADFRTHDAVPIVLLVTGGLFWLCVNAAMFYGMWDLFRARNEKRAAYAAGAMLLLLVCAFALMSGPVSNPRLRYKASPLMYLLASYGVVTLYAKKKEQEAILQ